MVRGSCELAKVRGSCAWLWMNKSVSKHERTGDDEHVEALAVVRGDDLELVEVRVDHRQEARCFCFVCCVGVCGRKERGREELVCG